MESCPFCEKKDWVGAKRNTKFRKKRERSISQCAHATRLPADTLKTPPCPAKECNLLFVYVNHKNAITLL